MVALVEPSCAKMKTTKRQSEKGKEAEVVVRTHSLRALRSVCCAGGPAGCIFFFTVSTCGTSESPSLLYFRDLRTPAQNSISAVTAEPGARRQRNGSSAVSAQPATALLMAHLARAERRRGSLPIAGARRRPSPPAVAARGLSRRSQREGRPEVL